VNGRMIDLDSLSSEDLAHLAHLKRDEERRQIEPPTPPWWRPDGSKPKEPDAATTKAFIERTGHFLLAVRVETAAYKMALGQSVFGFSVPWTEEEVVAALLPGARSIGLPEDATREAIATGIRLARQGVR